MYLLSIDDGSKMQNVVTPLDMVPHLIFTIVATIIYLALYYRKGSPHYLTLMCAVDATFVTQVWTSSVAIAVLAGVEIALITATIILAIKNSKRIKAENEAKEAAKKLEKKRAKSAEKADEEENDKLVENAFDD
ncbi:MAG: hypothetical protein IKP47_05540 [Ruminococcus sp.]|nr:hypothetical protein [Ruminococcus sp.]